MKYTATILALAFIALLAVARTTPLENINVIASDPERVEGARSDLGDTVTIRGAEIAASPSVSLPANRQDRNDDTVVDDNGTTSPPFQPVPTMASGGGVRGGYETDNPHPLPLERGESAIVVRVIDGDTIEIDGGERVRFIGVNTPESVDPRRAVQCFGKEASAYTHNLLSGKTIALEKDITDRDKYHRLLRYVWLDDILINEQLVRDGYAQVKTYPPDVKYTDRFLAAQQEAREEKRGLWSACEE